MDEKEGWYSANGVYMSHLSTCYLLSFLLGCDRPSHKDLLDYVVPHAAAKWYDLGLQLMDPRYENKLAIIKEDGRSDVQECCRKMLNYWLEAEESPTWNKVIRGLKAVRLNYVASNIEKELQGLSLTLSLMRTRNQTENELESMQAGRPVLLKSFVLISVSMKPYNNAVHKNDVIIKGCVYLAGHRLRFFGRLPLVGFEPWHL